jgi:hypothetical protein
MTPNTSRPTIVCLTPVKNEAWILERFLACASLWADQIIVADQGSDDGSQEIARRFPKVRLIENRSVTFNEPERQQMLIAAAREIPGPRLLIALDADEFMTANCLASAEWERMLAAAPGTVIKFEWPAILGGRRYYTYPAKMPFGFMDDGSPHRGQKIHSPRVPVPEGAPELVMRDVRVMHYIGIDMERWKSKLRWYQCWEWLNDRQRRLVQLYRFYHKDIFVPESAVHPVPREWVQGYEAAGIDVTNVPRQASYRWDGEVLRLLAEHGPDKFRRLSIWDADWERMSRELNAQTGVPVRDPRTPFDRLVHWWLRRTQPYYSHYGYPTSRVTKLYLRVVNRFLMALGW